MPAVAWFTVAVSAVIVAFTAVGLLRVILHLRAIRATLGQVLGGSAVIAQQTSTVPGVVGSVNANLKPVRDFAESI
jgi:hypothetical protein